MKNNEKVINQKEIAMRISKITIVMNLLLSIIKLLAGIIAHSGAMVSDAIHSASDVFSTFIVMIGVQMADRTPDKQHPYGHERMECVAAVVLSVVLFLTGLGIGINGVDKILHKEPGSLVIPGVLSLVVAMLSILVKEWMYWYTKRAADMIHSDALKADAWHHRTDAFSSIGALIGIAGARLGYPICDSIASVIICIFIFVAAIDIFKDALNKMLDTACDDQTENCIREIVLAQNGVRGISMLQTRMFGAKIYVDIEIEADGYLTLYESHAIAERVHDIIEQEFVLVKHCMVHVNPYNLDNK